MKSVWAGTSCIMGICPPWREREEKGKGVSQDPRRWADSRCWAGLGQDRRNMKWGDNWKQGNEREQGVKPDGKVLSLSLEAQSADDGKRDSGRPPPMGPPPARCTRAQRWALQAAFRSHPASLGQCLKCSSSGHFSFLPSVLIFFLLIPNPSISCSSPPFFLHTLWGPHSAVCSHPCSRPPHWTLPSAGRTSHHTPVCTYRHMYVITHTQTSGPSFSLPQCCFQTLLF